MSASCENLFVVSGVRTPFRKAGTDYVKTGADELARGAVAVLLARTGLDPALISEVIMGCVAQPMEAANLARVTALRAGIPVGVPALTVQRNCASGIESLFCAAQRAAAGRGDIFLVGGVENMSRIPLVYSEAAVGKFSRWERSRGMWQKMVAALRFRPTDFKPIVGLLQGLADPVCGLNMGQTAELLSREFGIGREAQDEFALCSHQKAVAAKERLREEIVPVYGAFGDAGFLLEDNGPREMQTLAALEKLRPVFEKPAGTVTAGNSSQITDGAVALLLMTERALEKSGLDPMGRLVDYVVTGCDPARMGLGASQAIVALSGRLGWKPAEADLVEINEAFAVQVLAVLEDLKRQGCPVEGSRLNPNGGAIALGHPVGATGARLVLTALHELRRSGGRRAIVSMCVGGGQGAAACFERV